MTTYVITLKKEIATNSNPDFTLIGNVIVTKNHPVVRDGVCWISLNEFIPVDNILGFVKSEKQD